MKQLLMNIQNTIIMSNLRKVLQKLYAKLSILCLNAKVFMLNFTN